MMPTVALGSSSLPPAPRVGVGGAGDRHSTTQTERPDDGFSAVLDALTRPAESRTSRSGRVDRPSTPSATRAPKAATHTPKVASRSQPDTIDAAPVADEKDDSTGPSTPTQGAEPRDERPAPVARTPQASTQAEAVPGDEVSAKEGTPPPAAAPTLAPTVLDLDAAVPLPAATVDDAPAITVAPAAVVPAPTAAPAQVAPELAAAPDPDAVEVNRVLPFVSHTGTASSEGRANVQAPKGHEPAVVVSDAVAGPVTELADRAQAAPIELAATTVFEDHAPRPEGARQGAPPSAHIGAAVQQAIEALGRNLESQTDAGTSGQDTSGGGSADVLGESQGQARPSVERASSGFVVPQIVATATPDATGVAGTTRPSEVTPAQQDHPGLESQLVQAMRVHWRGGVGEARVTLRPEYLGAVTISLRLESGGLHAHLQVEDPRVAAWVHANESQLKDALANQGLTLERLVVSDESSSREEGAQQGDRERRGSRRRHREPADGPRFEVSA